MGYQNFDNDQKTFFMHYTDAGTNLHQHRNNLMTNANDHIVGVGIHIIICIVVVVVAVVLASSCFPGLFGFHCSVPRISTFGCPMCGTGKGAVFVR